MLFLRSGESYAMRNPNIETSVFEVFQNIAGRYDHSNTIISMGMHGYWKSHMVHCLAKMLPDNGHILDLCCGTGDICKLFSRQKKAFSLTGADFSPNMLSQAEKKLAGLASVNLVCANAMQLPWRDETFDAVVISFGLRNTRDWKSVIQEMVRVTKTGGIVCIMDAHYPDHPWIRKGFSLYFSRIMPLLGGGLKNQREYLWLNQSAKEFAHWRELMKMMKESGLVHRRYRRFLFGSCVYQIGEKRSLSHSTFLC